MLEESRDIKLGFRYGQARTLFEDDPRWKVNHLLAPAHVQQLAVLSRVNQCPVDACMSINAQSGNRLKRQNQHANMNSLQHSWWISSILWGMPLGGCYVFGKSLLSFCTA